MFVASLMFFFVQLRKLITKVVTKGNLYYRKWTDRPVTDALALKNDDISIEKLISISEGKHSLVFKTKLIFYL